VEILKEHPSKGDHRKTAIPKILLRKNQGLACVVKKGAPKKKVEQVALEKGHFFNAHPFLYFFFDALFFRFGGVTALLGPRDLGFIELVRSVCVRAFDFFLDAPIGPFDLVPPLFPLFLTDLDDLGASLETRDLDTGFFLSALNADDPNPSSDSESHSESHSGSGLHLPRLLGRDSSGLKLGRPFLGGLPGCFLVDRGLVSTL
jgi:hypothetical protein